MKLGDDADFGGSLLDGSNLSRIEATKLNLNSTSLNDTNLNGVVLRQAEMNYYTTFIDARCDNAKIEDSELCASLFTQPEGGENISLRGSFLSSAEHQRLGSERIKVRPTPMFNPTTRGVMVGGP